ncbi:hypothetical protein Q5P01_018411 [Channa striata]|uniref:Uncharacterized protein n=1 Tax=Channa striata TaxID=64152 RepID=A0AA88S853_CHASR|nr:hypothetical protein Q5P01_018411 [Channa striata]
MRRRHKAPYAARECAHLAPSTPHVRRQPLVTRSWSRHGATHPAASEEGNKTSNLKTPEMENKTSSKTQVYQRLCVGHREARRKQNEKKKGHKKNQQRGRNSDDGHCSSMTKVSDPSGFENHLIFGLCLGVY